MRFSRQLARTAISLFAMPNKLRLLDGSLEIVGGRNMGNEYYEYPGSSFSAAAPCVK